jgi:hypothetical protein
VKIADCLHLDVDPRMPGQKFEHMIEEANSGRDTGHARSVEVDPNLDVGLLGLALDSGAAHEKASLNQSLTDTWPKTRPFYQAGPAFATAGWCLSGVNFCLW